MSSPARRGRGLTEPSAGSATCEVLWSESLLCSVTFPAPSPCPSAPSARVKRPRIAGYRRAPIGSEKTGPILKRGHVASRSCGRHLTSATLPLNSTQLTQAGNRVALPSCSLPSFFIGYVAHVTREDAQGWGGVERTRTHPSVATRLLPSVVDESRVRSTPSEGERERDTHTHVES